MLTVILIDDEEEILQGLSRIVDWTSIGYRVIHRSTDAVEALEKIKLLQPNVVLTDIKMPHLNGLDLIRHIKQSSPATKTIVISGYSDFDLVKQALQLGVFNYLLKPVDEDELLESLINIRALFQQEKPTQKNDTITPATLLRLISNAASVTLPAALSGKPCFLLSSIVSPGNGIAAEQAAEALRSWLSQYGPVSSAERNGVLFLLVFAEAPDYAALQSGYRQWFTDHGSCIFSICSTTIRKQDCLADWSRALSNQLLSDRFFGRTQPLSLLSSPICTQPHQASDWLFEYKPPLFREIRNKVNSMRFHEIPDLFAKIEPALRAPALNANPYEVRMVYRDALGYLKIATSELKDLYVTEQYLNEALMSIEIADTFRQISDLVVQAIRKTVQELPPPVCNGKVNVNHIRVYIHLHLAEDLSLSRVASLFYLSTSYLSTIFAKEIGQPFSSYVLSLRLQKAAEMLVQTNMSIGDICNAVGFSSEKTFFKQFRSHYHCTPTQYRNIAAAPNEGKHKP